MSRIYLIHENPEWAAPLHAALDAAELAHKDWLVDERSLALTEPPEGLFVNRMSASAHTRGHRYAPEMTTAILAWLEGRGRRVVNGSRALALELSKVAQSAALEAHGIVTPRTAAALGKRAILEAVKTFHGPFITKHNRAGKGLGMRLFHGAEALRAHLDGPDFEPSPDGITLVQDYVQAPRPFITRVEFVGAKFLYAVEVDTSDGFELCPADVCETEDGLGMTGGDAAGTRPKFRILADFESPLIAAYESFMAANHIDIAAFEFITDDSGVPFTYDINTNTNYNAGAEAEAEDAAAGRTGMAAQAAFFAAELARLKGPAAAAE